MEKSEFLSILEHHQRVIALFLKPGSPLCVCAEENLKPALSAGSDWFPVRVDVTQSKQIHPEYAIDSVPTVALFEKGKLVKQIKGCQDTTYYRGVLTRSVFSVGSSENGKKAQPSVTVYSTPTCSWCTRLKSYLDKHKITYRDIDVSVNQTAAEELVKRSGQTGVPQTDINGQMIVGFDKDRINKLLDIKE